MKAAIINAYGDPSVIEIAEVPVPQIGEDEVLIRVAASSFNPADAGIRSGALRDFIPVAFPKILGADAAGIVERVGAGVTGFAINDRVFAYVDFIGRGGQAELVAVKATEIAMAPKSLPLADAAALPAVGLTAWQALFVHGDLQPGQRVLVLGASGGVGTVAVQLAKWKGAQVIGVASGKQESLLNGLGVDVFIDYNSGSLIETVGQPVDLLVNASSVSSAELTKLLPAVARGGTVVSANTPPDQAEADDRGIRTIRMASQRDGGQLSDLSQRIDAGDVRPIIFARRPLSEIAGVHAENGAAHGKTVIIIDADLGSK